MPEKNRFPAVLHPVTYAFGSKGSGLDATEELAPTLRASGHAESHSNGGRTPAVAYSIMPMNSGKDYKARETQVAQPLMAAGPVTGNQGGDFIVEPVPIYAIQERAICENPTAGPDGVGVRGDGAAYTLEARTVPQAVCVTEPVTHTLKGEGFDASEDGTGRGQPITIAYPVNRDGTQPLHYQHDYAHGRVYGEQGCSPSLTTTDASGGKNIFDEVQLAVRRLMPPECERLQGFPDNWTLVPTGKNRKPAADGPRYKQCGNSMAVNCMAWIGARIAAHLAQPVLDETVEDLLG